MQHDVAHTVQPGTMQPVLWEATAKLQVAVIPVVQVKVLDADPPCMHGFCHHKQRPRAQSSTKRRTGAPLYGESTSYASRGVLTELCDDWVMRSCHLPVYMTRRCLGWQTD